jgi:hypothetical protein
MRRTGKWWHAHAANAYYLLQYVCPKCCYVGTQRVAQLPDDLRHVGTPRKLWRLRLATS